MDKKKKNNSSRSSAKSSANESSDEENVHSTTREAAGTASATSKAETKTSEATDVSPQLSRNEPSTSRESNDSPREKTKKPTQQEVMEMTLPVMEATTNIRAIATEIAKIGNSRTITTQEPSKTVVDYIIENIYKQRHTANQKRLGLDQLVYIESGLAKPKKQSYLYEGGQMATMDLVSCDEDVAMETNAVKGDTAEMETTDDKTLAENVKKTTKEQTESTPEAEVAGAVPQTTTAPEILSAGHSTNSAESRPTFQTVENNTIDVFGVNQQKGNASPTKQSENTANEGSDEVAETGQADEKTWPSDEENVQSTTCAAAGTASATSKPSKAETKTREGNDVSPQQPRNEPSTSRASKNSPKKKAKKPTPQEITEMSLATMKAKTNIREIATKIVKMRNKTQKPKKAVVDRFIDQIYAQRHKKNRANRLKLGLDELVYIEKRVKAKKQSYLYQGGKMVTIDLVSSDEDVAMETNAVKEDTTEKELLPENSDDETLAEDVKKTMEQQSESRSEAELTGALPQTTTAPELLDAGHSTNSTESPPTRQTNEVNTIDVFGANQQKDNARSTEQFENTANEGSDEVAETGQADERTWRIASDFQREIFELTFKEFVAHTNIAVLQRKWAEENHPGKEFLEDDEVEGLRFYYSIRLDLKRWRRSILKNLKYKACHCKPNKTVDNNRERSQSTLEDVSMQQYVDQSAVRTQTPQKINNQEDITPDSSTQCSPPVLSHVQVLQSQEQLTAPNRPTQDPLRTQNITDTQTAATPNENPNTEIIDEQSNNTPSARHTENTQNITFMEHDSNAADTDRNSECDDEPSNKAIKPEPASICYSADSDVEMVPVLEIVHYVPDSSDELNDILNEVKQGTINSQELLLPNNQQTQVMDQTTLIDVLSQSNITTTASENQQVVNVVHTDSPATKQPLANILNTMLDGEKVTKTPVKTVKHDDKLSNVSKKRTLAEKAGPKSKKQKASSNDDTLSTIEPPRYTYYPLEFATNEATNSTTFDELMPNEQVDTSQELLIDETQFSSPEISLADLIEDDSPTQGSNLSQSNNIKANESISADQQTLNENNTMLLAVLTQPMAPQRTDRDLPDSTMNAVVEANAEGESANPDENVPDDAVPVGQAATFDAAVPRTVSNLGALTSTPSNLRDYHRFEFIHAIDITNINSNLTFVRELNKEILDFKITLRFQCNGNNKIIISGESPQKLLKLNSNEWEAAKKILVLVRMFESDSKNPPDNASILHQALHYLFKTTSKFSSKSYVAFGDHDLRTGQVFDSTHVLRQPDLQCTIDPYVLSRMNEHCKTKK